MFAKFFVRPPAWSKPFRTLQRDSSSAVFGTAASLGAAWFAVPLCTALIAHARPRKIEPRSVRKPEINQLLRKLECLQEGQYVVVTGEQGLGKSCLINTALEKNRRVIHVEAYPSNTQNVIINKMLGEIGGKRVLDWFKLLGWELPVVVVHVSDRMAGDAYASVPAAVRALTEDYGVKVVVDTRPHASPPELFLSNRENVLNVEPMTREIVRSVPEFDETFTFLEENKLDDAVWKVVGGNPELFYYGINLKLDTKNKGKEENIAAVKSTLGNILMHSHYHAFCGCGNNTTALVKHWMNNNWSNKKAVSMTDVEAAGFTVDLPNNVFRVIKEKDGTASVVPKTAAIALQLSENVAFSLDAVDQLKRKLFD